MQSNPLLLIYGYICRILALNKLFFENERYEIEKGAKGC